jgi:hypothetical protein
MPKQEGMLVVTCFVKLIFWCFLSFGKTKTQSVQVLGLLDSGSTQIADPRLGEGKSWLWCLSFLAICKIAPELHIFLSKKARQST